MTLSKEELSGLVERVRGLKGPDREVDGAIEVQARRFDAYRAGLDDSTRAQWQHNGCTVFDGDTGYDAQRFTASVDASLALVERVLPGWVIADLRQNSRHAGDPWGCTLAVYYGSQPSRNREVSSGYDYPSAPLAILLALLLSLQSQEPTP